MKCVNLLHLIENFTKHLENLQSVSPSFFYYKSQLPLPENFINNHQRPQLHPYKIHHYITKHVKKKLYFYVHHHAKKKKTLLLCSSLIAATCTAMVFQLGQTQLPLLTSIGLIPGLPQLVNLGDITKRLSSVKDIRGCLMGLHTSVCTVQFADTIGSVCSKAFLAIDGYCMSKLFTLNPLFPPLLKSYCSI